MIIVCHSCQEEKKADTEDEIHRITWLKKTRYYYSCDEKIYLDEAENKVVLSYDDQYLPEIQRYLQKDKKIKDMKFLNQRNFFICTFITVNANTKAIMENLRKQAGVKSVNPMYTPTDGVAILEMAITGRIAVQFKKSVSRQEVDDINKRYRVTIQEVTERFDILFVPVDLDPLEVSNAYQTSGMVVFSTPDFLSKMTTR
jgi:hypothetical protein